MTESPMSDEFGHEKRVLAGVLPDRKDNLLYLLQHLEPDHFRLDRNRNFFVMLERYYDVASGVLPRKTLSDIMGRQEISEEITTMVSALRQSVCSILDDQDLSADERTALLQQTFDEFHQAASAGIAAPDEESLSKIAAQAAIAKSYLTLQRFP